MLIKPEVVSTHVNAQASYAAPADGRRSWFSDHFDKQTVEMLYRCCANRMLGCRAQVAVAEECLWLLSQSIYNIRYTEAVALCTLCDPLSVDLCRSLWTSAIISHQPVFCLGHTLGLFHSTAESGHNSYVFGQVSRFTL